jgi:enamine deaminase RidA (YjgF/YER057c/UK114 family)
MTTPEHRLEELGIKLPDMPNPIANYVRYKQVGDLVFLSGQGPRKPDGSNHTGKVGQDVSVDDAYQHARLTGMGLLAAMRQAAGGSLNHVEVVKVLGMVNATPDFAFHPQVINGCSDLFVEVLGEQGRHARSAVGMGSLPNNITVEIEAIIRIRP